ncbi:MAG: signal peptide peptidase SppA [Bacteroidales bacterium]|nr:signal peptide peptidase SppA [Bacteroidales bacterium]
MKDFVKTVLAVICGYFVLRIIGFLFLLFFLVGALAGSGKPSLPKNGVLDLDMSSFVLAEQSKEASAPSMMSMNFDMTPLVGLHDAVEAIHAAAADPGVKYILLRPEGAMAGMGGAEEFRAAIASFRESGKPVVAYVENPSNGSFYLASVADKIYMGAHHGGNSQLVGLSAQMLFLKDVLDKLGVNVQLIRHGKYKSAGEMFVRSSSSPENREQNQIMVNSAWKVIGGAIANARDLSEEAFNALIDELALNLPEDYLQAGLVDELVDHESLLGKLCTLAQVEDSRKLKLIPFADYVTNRVTGLPGRSNVAVIYADGEIVDGKEYNNVAGDRFVRIIDKIRKDKSVKAVVLRVNSPGGSVSASEKIRAALDLLQKEKPLVASFGDYAASGGYWISSGCQKIYADATSITGSIGVFSMIPEFSDVTKKMGVAVETVGSNKHSDMFSLMRPFNGEELRFMQASVEDIYERFVNLVASSRGLDPARVDEIAQGRVWTGGDALEIGLVDEIGTLEDAIAYAASLAELYSSDGYSVVGYPQPLTLVEEFMSSLGQRYEEPSILSGTPFEALGKAVGSLKAQEPGLVYARLPYALEIR